jgi:ABC-type transporter Mla MlaB component
MVLSGLIIAFRTRDADLTLTLKIKQICEKRGTRIWLSGELRSTHLDELRVEIEQVAPPVTLDLDEVEIVDIDGVRLLNELQAQGIQVVNCSPYIREWMLQENAALKRRNTDVN